MKEETMRLNPFVYISETDIRFYLLVVIGIIVPSLWAVVFGIVMGQLEIMYPITIFQRLLITVPIFAFIPLLIYWNHKRFPKKIMKESKLKEFGPKKFPDHCEYVEKLYGKYLLTVKQPTLMYQPLDLSESAFTFGTKNHVYIGISGGLIAKFRKNIDGFKSVFLHEMGHIANRDVEKTYLADSTWRSLRLSLPIPLGISLLYTIYITLGLLFSGMEAGYEMDYIISRMHLEFWSSLYGGIALFYLFFFIIVYVLRNQLIRLREFYADAKVLEWEESPKGIINTLEESGGKQYSKFEILTKFHPNINERVQVLRDNLRLFTPSLWVALTIGFFYSTIESRSSFLKTFMFSWGQMVVGIVELDVEFRALISIVIFTILMLAISSSFHKSILKDVFVGNARYFSTATILNVVKFSLAFSLGYLTENTVSLLSEMGIDTFMRDLPVYPQVWVLHAAYLSTALIFLLIFASLLIRRSFSKKEAERNFLMVTVLSSLLYIINRFYAIETLHNKPLLIVSFLIFSIVTYTFVKIKDRKLFCPNCNNRVSNLSGLKLNCPNCRYNLYSWAVYSFSKNSVS